MKRVMLVLCVMLTFFAGCRKDDVIEPSKVKMNEETIERGWDYVKISGEYEYPVVLEAMSLYLSDKEDLSGAKTYDCALEGKNFTVEADGLKGGVVYYYQYEYDNGYTKEKGEVCSLLYVTTNNVSNITVTTATCGGNVTSDGNGTVTVRGVCWSTSQNPTVNDNKTSDGSGTGSFTSHLTNLRENTTYYVRAYATNEKGTSYGEEKSFKTNSSTGTINSHDWIDLGLPSGLKWAASNVGATSAEDYGDYFAWGETTTKSDYSSSNSLTYGLSESQLQSQGYIDGSGNLTSQHDAARANWGGSWRMPTKAELEELKNKCTWTWTTQNGVKGYKVTGPNGNSIFLPAAGYRYGSSLNNDGYGGRYWSSTHYESDSYGAYGLDFGSGNQLVYSYYRDFGRSVRPVSE